MGIQPWEVRTAPSAVAPAPVVADLSAVDDTAELSYKTSHKPSLNSNLESHPSQSLLADGAIANMDWETLRRTALQCERCELHRTRTQVVFGVGDQQAQWLVVGEAPGAEEDRQGEPFVGRAGQLLNNMLLAIGLRREQIYIANVVVNSSTTAL